MDAVASGGSGASTELVVVYYNNTIVVRGLTIPTLVS
jgi:hypothetical protein